MDPIATSRPSGRAHADLKTLALFGALVMLLAWLGFAVSRGTGNVASLWLPNAALAVAILRTGWATAARWAVAAFAGYVAADMLGGTAFTGAAIPALINCADVLGGTWLLLRWLKAPPDMARIADLSRFALTCCVVAPACSALLAAFSLDSMSPGFSITLWRDWFLAKALGMLIAGPPMLIAIDAWRRRHRIDRDRLHEIAAILIANAAAAMLVFGQSQFPLLFLALPMVVLAAFRLGLFGTVAAIAIVAVIAIAATLYGNGPTLLISGTLGTRIHIVQLFLATAFAIGLPLASAIFGRERIREELKGSRDFSETLVSSMQEVVFRTDPAGRWIFLNPAWETLTGYSVEQSLGRSTGEILHPDDRVLWDIHSPNIVSGTLSDVTQHNRILTMNGGMRHVEVILRRLSEPDGRFAGTIGTIRDISETVATQAALADSEARFRRLTETVPVSIFRARPDGMVTYLNHTWCQTIGLTVEESLGQGWMRALADPERYWAEQPMRQFQPGEIRMQEVAFRRPDGRIVWVEAVTISEVNHAGAITGFIGALVDITAQREASAALAESKRLFETLADLSPAGIFRTDVRGRATYVNRALMGLTGRNMQQMLGFGWTKAVHPEDFADVLQIWREVARGSEKLRRDFRFVRPDGERWVELIAVDEYDTAANRIGFLGVAVDITERKVAEAALAASEEQLRLLAENATDAVVRLSLDGVCLYASPSVAEIFHLHPRHLVGQQILTRFHPEDADAVLAQQRALAAGEIDRCVTTYRSEAINQTGRWIWLEANSGLVRDPETNKPREIISSIRDITKRKELEIALDSARRHAEVAARAKSSFLANMSHEIRTPMNGVLGFTDLLLAENPRPDQQLKLRMIAESGTTMMRLLNDILDISKIEAGHVTLAKDRVDLRTLAENCVTLIMPITMRTGVELRTHVADDVPRAVTGDALRLRQIILNLLGNAAKFTDQGSIVLQIAVSDGALVISVSDTGIGIATDRQDAIFGEFVQESPETRRKYGGTGLGLAISSELATLMKGSLSLFSVVGVGTTVTLRVPLVLATEHSSDGADDSAITLPAVPGARVLVVEDLDVNQMLIKAMLTRLGYEAAIASGGTEAIAMVQEATSLGKPYGLVLMDMQMPDMDGLTATQHIRQAGLDDAALPIVALTANAYSGDISACFDAGMQDHLAKPVRLNTLDQTVRRWAKAPPAPPAPPPYPMLAASADPDLIKQFEARTRSAIELLDTALDSPTPSPDAIAALRHAMHLLAGTSAFFGKAKLGTIASEVDAQLSQGDEIVTQTFLKRARTRLIGAGARAC